VLFAFGGLSALSAGGLLAQGATSGTIAGRVTDARSQLPVPGVTVRVDNTLISGTTAADGRYRLTNVPLGLHGVSVRRIGFAGMTQSVTVVVGSDAPLDFVLQPSAISLDQVMVTGTAGGQTRREIGNAVSIIDADSALSKSAAPSLSNLIDGRAAGVSVASGTSRLGAAQAIQIRGRSSLSLDNSPLLYIDGIRVNSGTGLGSTAGGFSGQNSSVGGRLNDINPEDIQSIEIIKGPSAATLYGTEATNGVIQIVTKRGAAGGKAQFNFQVEAGALSFANAAGRMPTNYAKDATGTIVAWNGVSQQSAAGTPLFQSGLTRKYSGSISGGRDAVSYFVSAAFENDHGIEPNNTLRQFSMHTNLNIVANPELTFSTSLNYVNNIAHLGVDAGASAMLGAELGHKLIFPAGLGFYPNWQPAVFQTLWDTPQSVNRFTGSETITNHPYSWLTHRLVVGIDYTNEDDRNLENFAPPALAVGLPNATGRISQTLRNAAFITGDYSGTATIALTPSMSSATSLGAQYYRSEANISTLGGLSFPAPGVTTISATATPITPTQSYVLNTTIGGYVQQQFGWRDRLFLTGAIRVDNNSAFGSGFKWVTYPKLSASWVVNEEPFWKTNRVIDALRVRASYGESGRQPAAFAALKTYSPVQGPGGTNAVTAGSIGNANLQPERGKEFELGLEGSLFDRLTFDITYWSKRTVNEIVAQSIAPSSGFAGSQFKNLGEVDNGGIEALLTLQVLRRQNVSWEISGNFGTNGDKIKNLGGIPSLVTASGQYNTLQHPIGGIYSKRVVSASQDATTGLATSVLCDGGPGAVAIACPSAPFVYLGTPTPTYSGGVSNTVTLFKRLRLFANVDFRGGNKVYNSVEQFRCQGLVGVGFCDVNYHPLNYNPKYVAETNIGAFSGGTWDQFYQDGSFVKLREVSASYQLPEWMPGLSRASISLAGRNLHTWTKYRGIDPEVNVANTAVSSTTQDQGILPPLQQIVFMIHYKY
jgi:TonB-linked SusC/RagA family outer membrane protein